MIFLYKLQFIFRGLQQYIKCILMFTSGKRKSLALGRMFAGAWTL